MFQLLLGSVLFSCTVSDLILFLTLAVGARRLHTVIEKIMEDVSFNAPDLSGQKITVDTVQVLDAIGDLAVKHDLSRFIL